MAFPKIPEILQGPYLTPDDSPRFIYKLTGSLRPHNVFYFNIEGSLDTRPEDLLKLARALKSVPSLLEALQAVAYRTDSSDGVLYCGHCSVKFRSTETKHAFGCEVGDALEMALEHPAGCSPGCPHRGKEHDHDY